MLHLDFLNVMKKISKYNIVFITMNYMYKLKVFCRSQNKSDTDQTVVSYFKKHIYMYNTMLMYS